MARCFVISPIGPEGSAIRKHADNVFEFIIAPALEQEQIEPIRSDQLQEPGQISQQMLQQIARADLCVAVLTDHNPNVYYELAIAQCAARPLIILLLKGQTLPFDVQDLRTVYYDFDPGEIQQETYAQQIRAQVDAIKAAGWKTAPLVGDPTSAEKFTEIERIKSDHPILEIVATIQEDGARVNARIVALSDMGKQFYGYRSDTPLETFRDKPAGEFMLKLKPYIDPPPTFWDDLLKDQSRVHARFAASREALAMVPVRFNEWHPYFPNRVFVPLISGAHQSDQEEYTRVLYLDAAKLPRYLFGAQLWDDAKQDVDMAALAQDFDHIQVLFEKEGISRARIEALQAAAAEIAKGGSVKALRLLAEAGLFSLLEKARDEQLGHAKLFLERLLGPSDH